MRMRKKKHLEERLANCNNVITLRSDDCNFLTAIEKKEYIDTEALLATVIPLCLKSDAEKAVLPANLQRESLKLMFLLLKNAPMLLSLRQKMLKKIIFQT